MPTNLKQTPAERGTIRFDVDFQDDEGKAVAPDSVAYTLTDKNGAVVGDLKQVDPGLTLAESMTFKLSGPDLLVLDTETDDKVERRFVLEYTYTSDLGAGLPDSVVGIFHIENVAGAPFS